MGRGLDFVKKITTMGQNGTPGHPAPVFLMSSHRSVGTRNGCGHWKWRHAV